MANFLIRQPRCVFIHIPKVAGSSIRRGVFGADYERPVFGYLPSDWDNYFKFAFVRNPFDRVVSAWKMFTTGMRETVWQYPKDGKRDLSLLDFLNIVTNASIIFDERRTTFEEKIRHHTIPQTHSFNCLQLADFVGRFESLKSDFATVCRRLDIDACALPHWNSTAHNGYRAYFDQSTRRIAEDYYQQDLATLGYEF